MTIAQLNTGFSKLLALLNTADPRDDQYTHQLIAYIHQMIDYFVSLADHYRCFCNSPASSSHPVSSAACTQIASARNQIRGLEKTASSPISGY